MEAVGPGAGITGILSVADQSLRGLLELRALATSIEDTARSAPALIDSACRLGSTLEELFPLLKRVAVQHDGVAGSTNNKTDNGPSSGATGVTNSVASSTTKTSACTITTAIPTTGSIAPILGADSTRDELRHVLESLGRCVHICAGEIQRINSAFPTDACRTILEGSINDFWNRIAYREQALRLELSSLAKHTYMHMPLTVHQRWDATPEKIAEWNASVSNKANGLRTGLVSNLWQRQTVNHVISMSSEASSTVLGDPAGISAGAGSNLAGGDVSAAAARLTHSSGGGPLKRKTTFGLCVGARMETPPLPPRSSWGFYTCDALTGIDDATENRDDGALGCLFCGRGFPHHDETAYNRLGAHLVRAHAFGLCNLNCTFGNRADLLTHLRTFHGWSRSDIGGSGSAVDNDEQHAIFLDRLFQPHRSPAHTRIRKVFALEDGNSQPPRGTLEDNEQTGLLNLLVLNQILRVAGLEVDMAPQPRRPQEGHRHPLGPSVPLDGWPAAAADASETTLGHELCVALTKLDRLANEAKAGGGSCSKYDIDDLVYHAACVQQELAVSNSDDVLRYEALYSADQYRIDDLVFLYNGGGVGGPSRRPWRLRTGPEHAKSVAAELRRVCGGDGRNVTPNTDSSGNDASASTSSVPSLTRRLPVSATFRSFRDAVRQLGRARMAHTGEKSYVAAMPRLLRAAAFVLRQPTPLSPDAPLPAGVLERSGSSKNSGNNHQQQPVPVVTQPLTLKNLARLADLQEQQANMVANTPTEKRLRWLTGSGLDWWFFSMLETSASFRRLVRCGKAFPGPEISRRSSTKTSKAKGKEKAASPRRTTPPRPGAQAKNSQGQAQIQSMTAATRTQLAPYAWAAALLNSTTEAGAGVTLGASAKVVENGIGPSSGGRVGEGNTGGYGSGDKKKKKQTSTLPAVSLVGADHGSSGSEPSSEASLELGEKQTAERQQQQQAYDGNADNYNCRGDADLVGVDRPAAAEAQNNNEGGEDEEESEEEEDDADGSSWESSSA